MIPNSRNSHDFNRQLQCVQLLFFFRIDNTQSITYEKYIASGYYKKKFVILLTNLMSKTIRPHTRILSIFVISHDIRIQHCPTHLGHAFDWKLTKKIFCF